MDIIANVCLLTKIERVSYRNLFLSFCEPKGRKKLLNYSYT